MRYRQLGGSGLTVSELGLGCNNFGMRIDADASAAVVRAALEHGITHFDTAHSYGGGRSEEYLGAALGGRRDEVVIATKFGSPRQRAASDPAPGSRANVLRSCETSLRRLGTDHIDLYYLHFPDPATPLDETLAALDDLVRHGKVRYVATSNMAGWQVAEAQHLAGRDHLSRPVACQVEWSLLERDVEREVVPACRHYGVGIVPYFPLASGLLTGKYRRGADFPPDSRLGSGPSFAAMATDERFDRVDELRAVAGQQGTSLLSLALGWLLAHDGVPSVLAGATSPEQVAANVAAVERPLPADLVAHVTEVLDRPAG
ncbi:MAG: aldo/keto reductase [Acidimicrobiales bacterium]